MSLNKIFNRVRGHKPSKSIFNLSHEKLLTCDMGELIPILALDCIPGDHFKIGNQCVLRFQPLVAPVLHEVQLVVNYFFVPYSQLWDDWEEFITLEDDTSVPTLPTWTCASMTVGTLWDYFGFPILGGNPVNAQPLDFMRRAYNHIWNEWYRDENLQTELNIATNETLKNVNWSKDYFTSAFTSQQKGTAPALPISGSTSAVWSSNDVGTNVNMMYKSGETVPISDTQTILNNNTVDLSSATTFDVNDLRLAFQQQKFLERNMRCGNRYAEHLMAHFGENNGDLRMSRPHHIGGTLQNVIFSEVLQTSETNSTPQGTLAGHGITVTSSFAGKYHVREFGIILGLMTVRPVTAYHQGIDRMWLKDTVYDYPFPEFVGLGEQPVIEAEILASTSGANNATVFGYQGRHNEYRYHKNVICGDMHATYDYWHLARQFGSRPSLDDTFITCTPRKDIFAAPSVDGLIVNFGNIVTVLRSLPLIAEPGLIDHY